MDSKTNVVFIAGGGTGGHIYPALAIAKALQKIQIETEEKSKSKSKIKANAGRETNRETDGETEKPDFKLDIHFVGTQEGLEVKILSKENFPLHLIQGGKLNFSGHWFKKIKTLVKIPLGFFQSLKLILKFKPNFILGVGGYASGPFVLMGSLMGVKTALWEANAQPGLTNRWLAPFVNKCYLVFKEAESKLKNKNILIFGMPVREEIEQAYLKQNKIFNNDKNNKNNKNENQNDSDSDSDNRNESKAENNQRKKAEFHILCFGGSQGARAISNVLSDIIIQGGAWLENTSIIHQTGSLDFERIKKKYEMISFDKSSTVVNANAVKSIAESRIVEKSIVEKSISVEPMEFIYDMPTYYKWADLVICRGGAGTLAEISAFGLVPIIIPLPLADNHQEKNAQVLVEKEAALMILQKDLSGERLIHEILKLKADPNLKEKMSHNLKAFFQAEASYKIAQDIYKNLNDC